MKKITLLFLFFLTIVLESAQAQDYSRPNKDKQKNELTNPFNDEKSFKLIKGPLPADEIKDALITNYMKSISAIDKDLLFREDFAKRDLTTKQFTTDSINYTAIIGAGAVHYLEDDTWKTILNTIDKNNSGVFPTYPYYNKYNSFKTFYGNASDGIIVCKPEGVLSYGKNQKVEYLDAEKNILSSSITQYNQPEINDNIIKFTGSQSSIDLVYEHLTIGVEQRYIINDSSFIQNIPSGAKYLSFSQEILLPEGARIDTVKKDKSEPELIIYDRNNIMLFKIAHIVMYDQRCESKSEYKETHKEIPGGFYCEKHGNSIIYKILVPISWIAFNERQYPVTIDPTIDCNPNNTTYWTGTAASNGGSGYQNSRYSDRMLQGFNDLTWPANNEYYQSYSKINLSGIASNSCINSATYYLYQSAYEDWSGCNENYFRIGRYATDPVTDSWATIYSNIDNLTTEYSRWSVYGGSGYNDYDETTTGWKAFPTGSTGVSDILSRLSSGWITIGQDNLQGYDSHCGTGSDDSGWIDWYNHTSTNRPILRVDYTAAISSSAISGGSTNICYNTSPGTFTATGSGCTGTYSYLWYKNGASTGVTTQTYNPGTLTGNTTVYCAVTCCGTINTPTKSINIYPTFIPTLSGTTSICAGTSANLKFNVQGSTGPYSLTYLPSGGSNTVINGLSNGSTFSVSPTTTTNYSIVSVSDVNGCTSNGNLVVNPDGILGLTTWSFTNGGSGWSTVASYPGFITSYANCIKSQTIDLIANGYTAAELDAKPNIYVSDNYIGYNTTNDSYGLLTQLRQTSTGSATNSYSYPSSYTTPGTPSYITTSGSWQTVSNTYSGYSSGVRYVYFEDAGKDVEYWGGQYGSVMGASTVKVNPVVTVNAIPTQTITAASSVCAGSSGNTASVPISTGGSYSWSITNGTITGGSGTSSLTYTAGTTSPLTLSCVVTSSAGNGGCASVGGQNQSVTIKAIPTQTITAASSVCAGSTGNTASVPISIGGSYSWSITNGTITGGSGTSSITYTAGTTSPLTLSCVVTSSAGNGGCASAGGQNQSVTINAIPTAPTSASVSPTSACSGVSTGYTLTYSGGSAGGSGGTLVWYEGACSGTPIGSGNSVSITRSLTSNTTYYCRWESSSCGNSTCASATVTVNALPNNTTSGFSGSPICLGETGVLTYDALDATFVTPYSIIYTDGTTSWSQTISSASPTQFNVAVNPTSTTTYSLVSITNENGCNTSTNFGKTNAQILVRALPTITTATTAISGCNSSSIQSTSLTYSATTGTPTTYSIVWNASPTNSFVVVTDAPLPSSPISISIPANTVAGTYTGTITVKNANGCISTGTTFTVTLNAIPTIASISSPAALCAGGSINPTAPIVTANGSAVASQGWQLETGVGSGTFTNLTVPYTVTFADNGKTIRYYATNSCGITYSNAVAITVNIPSVAPTSISGTTTICNGSSTTLTAVGGTLGTGATYQWGTGSIIGTNPLLGETSISYTPSTAPTATTTYWVEITNTSSPCTGTPSGVIQVVTVNQPSSGPLTASATSTTICNGQSTSLILIGGTPGTNSVIHWYTGSCGGTSVGTGNSLPVSPTTTTTYYGRYEDPSPCSSYSSCGSVTITVNTPSSGTPSASASSSTICSGQSTNLSLSGGTAGTNSVIHWYTGSCGGTSVGTGNYWSTGTLTSTTTFYGRYEDQSPCCSNSSCGSVVVTIITPSSGTASNTIGGGHTQTICYNTSPASMSVSGASGSSSFSYLWFSHPGAVTPTSGDPSGWTVASGTGINTATFSAPVAITGTTTYACWVMPGGSSSCGSANWAGASNNDNIQVTVETAFSGGTLDNTTQDICYNTQPSDITYSTPPGGGTTPTFQWYYLVGSQTAPSGTFSQGSWTAIGSTSTSTPTLAGTTIGNLTTTTTFALRVYDGGSTSCYDKWAGNAQVITVGVSFSGGTLTSATQTSCYNVNPSDITYSSAPGGGTNPTFQWYYLAGSQTAPSGAFSQGSWTAIGNPSTSTPTLSGSTVGNLTATTTFALEVYDDSPSSCFDNWAGNAQVITIDATFSAGTISSGGQIICHNTQPSNITYSTAPTGGTVTTFQWYYLAGSQTAPSGSFSQGSWTAIGSPSTSTTTLTGATIGNLTGTTTFALRVYDGGSAHCFDNWNGDCHIVTVRGAHNGGTISNSTQSICYNTTPSDITYSASPSGGTSLSYQWYTQTGTVAAPSGNWSLGSWTAVGSSGSSPSLLGTTIGTLPTPGIYTYALRATDGGGTTCFDVWNGDRHVITVYPDASMGTVSGTTPLCTLVQATYSANPVVLSGGIGVWSSDNTSIATVNSSTGVVTAVASGTCNIKFTINGGCNITPSSQQALTINQNASISGVNGTSPLCIGGSATYTTSGLNLGGGTGGWSSDNTAIATVNSSGVVTGVAVGTTYIVYSISGCGGAPSAKKLVTVDPNASIGSVTGTTPLCINANATYHANTVVLGGGAGYWSSDHTDIATVDASTGVVTAVNDGSCNIIYSITGGCNASPAAQQLLNVNPDASITGVTGTTPLCIGQTTTYSTFGAVMGGGTGAWSSSSTSIATVNSSGIITALSAGSCWIIYTIYGCNGTPTAKQKVTITPNASIASVSGTSPICIGSGNAVSYTANVVVLGGGSGAWSSDNTTIATVTSNGMVTGVAAGNCNIVYTITGGCGGTQSAQQALTINGNSWLGIVSTDWNNASNWCNGIPTSMTDVVIPSGTTYAPHITSLPTIPAACNNLTINSGAVLTIDAGRALTVNGTTTLASAQCLILKAAAGQAAGGTGSFIDNGITGLGTAKVEKYLSNGRYWYIGSPIASTSAVNAYGALSTVPSTGTRDFYWNEPTHAYITMVSGDLLIPTRGYAWEDFSSTSITANYTGSLNTGTYTANLTYTSGTKQGFNLVSNPYPSAINWGSQNSPVTGLTQTNLEPTIQYKVPGTYATWNSMGNGVGVNGGGAIIPAMQAFWVRVAAGNTTGSIQFTNSIRLHSPQGTYKLTDPLNLFRMQVARDTLVDESVVTFYPAALGSFENYDSPKMLSDEASYPQLYSYTTNSIQVAVNGQPLLVTGVERIIPLGFLTNVAGNFKITATNLAQFDANTTVYLEDVLLNTTQNLSSNKTYAFASAVGTFNSRFKLHFNKSSNSLPIQLTNFDAKCTDSNVDLNWSTATETNNDYFTIENSADANNWTFVKKVAGAGNSNSLLNYSAKDNYPLSGISYYRLKQTDFNGQSETFSPVAVNCTEESSQLDITYYPNPFTSKVFAVINNSISENATISIYNVLGSKVYNQKISHDQLELKTFSLDLSKLVDGIYFIEFKSDTYSGISKIVKN